MKMLGLPQKLDLTPKVAQLFNMETGKMSSKISANVKQQNILKKGKLDEKIKWTMITELKRKRYYLEKEIGKPNKLKKICQNAEKNQRLWQTFLVSVKSILFNFV